MNCESRVALIGIVVSESSSVSKLNEYLHECAHYIIGRMGVPYEKAGVSIISVAIDAPQDVINTLSGKLGALIRSFLQIVQMKRRRTIEQNRRT